MRRPRLLLAPLLAVALLAGGSAIAQDAPLRLVLAPFEATTSVDALGLSLPAALQRGLNELDGVYAPPVGDAGLVLQRLAEAGREDALDVLAAAFEADALVLGRVTGDDALTVELVVLVDGEERAASVSGRLADLAALARSLADAVLDAVGATPGTADRAAMNELLGDVPSLPSLGPVGVASARLPNVRADALRVAVDLDPASAWVRAEFARAAVLDGDVDGALAAADAAVELQDAAEVRAVQGVARLVAGDLEGAATAFEAALAHNPAHAVALVGLAQTVPAAERAALLARAVAAAPRQVDAQLGLAALQTSASAGIQSLRRAAERLPDSPSVLAALVDVTVGAGDARGALELLRVVSERPLGDTPAAYLAAARLPESVADAALAFVRSGAARFPGSAELRRLEAELLRRAGDATGAEAALRAAVDADPTSVADVRALARLLAERGAGDEAQALWATVADRAPDGAVVAAELDLAAGRPRAALATLEPLVAAGAADADVRTLYGIALGRTGRVDDARAALGAVLAEDPTAELAARALALLEERERFAADGGALALEGEAAAAFDRALTALELGEFARAAEGFAAVRAVQDAGLVAFYEGYARQRAGDPRAAIVAYEAARVELGDQDVLLNNLGYAHLQVGRFDLALPTLRAAVDANPQNARAHLNLGLALYGVGRFGDAVASFDRALALEPGLEASAADQIADARRRASP